MRKANIIYTSLVFIFAFSFQSQEAMAQKQSQALTCPSLAGSYSGSMNSAPMKMDVDGNCNATWTMPDGQKNYCQIQLSQSPHGYSCSMGSVGSVQVSPGKLVFRHRSGSYVVNVSRSKK